MCRVLVLLAHVQQLPVLGGSSPRSFFTDTFRLQDTKSTNVMRDIKVAKLVLNICVGESGDRLSKAARVRLALTWGSPRAPPGDPLGAA